MSDSNVQREKVFEQVVRIMADTLEISPEEISADLSFNSDLPFDSLQLYEFVIDLEEAYNIKLPDEMLDQMKTVDDIVNLIMRLTDGK